MQNKQVSIVRKESEEKLLTENTNDASYEDVECYGCYKLLFQKKKKKVKIKCKCGKFNYFTIE